MEIVAALAIAGILALLGVPRWDLLVWLIGVGGGVLAARVWDKGR